MEKPEDPKPGCPILNGPCVEKGCKFWSKLATQFQGKTEETWECVVLMVPFLILENSKMVARNGAAIESLRDEEIRVGQQVINALLEASKNSMPQLGGM